jgi:hypothetical protein
LVVAVLELAAGAAVYVFLGVTSLDATLNAATTYTERGMLLAPLLLLFATVIPSVTVEMVRFALSVAMATSASETSQGRLAVDPNILAFLACVRPAWVL